MGRGVNTGALSPVGGIGEIRMRANLRKIVAYKDFANRWSWHNTNDRGDW